MNNISELLWIRVIASYLGEKSQFNWWQCDFFRATAPSFLEPTFPRTRFLAQAEGSAAAARRLHDERIGVGRVFHLFRLPEDFEQTFHQKLQDSNVAAELSQILVDRVTALQFLEDQFGEPKKEEVGPILVGNIDEITTKPVIAAIGQVYLAGFQNETCVFPYFKEEQ